MLVRTLALILTLASTAPTLAWADDADVLAWVAKGGLSPVDPPTPAADFSLPDLAGEQHTLGDFQGRWVLLTFFATWCGPCASEMPSLERLSKSLAGEGFDVVGISTDRNTRPIRPWLKKHGATFSVLHDAKGQAGRLYRAQSIPLSYLIDPSGRVVGVARGAREWASFEPVARQLLAEAPWDGSSAPVTADASEPVQLPPGVEPPTATVRLARDTVTVGETAEVAVDVHWQGELRDYVLLPPTVAVPEGLVSQGTKAKSSSGAGKQQITYTIALQTSAVGDFALDPVEVRYTPAGGTEPMLGRVAGPTLSVVPVTWLGLAPAMWAGLGLGGAALTGLGAAGVVWRTRRPAAAASAADDLRAHEASFSAARRARMNGDVAGYLSAMRDLYEALGIEVPGDLSELIERVRYGGEAPDGRRLDAMERAVRRVLKDQRAQVAIDDPDFDDGEDA